MRADVPGGRPGAAAGDGDQRARVRRVLRALAVQPPAGGRLSRADAGHAVPHAPPHRGVPLRRVLRRRAAQRRRRRGRYRARLARACGGGTGLQLACMPVLLSSMRLARARGKGPGCNWHACLCCPAVHACSVQQSMVHSQRAGCKGDQQPMSWHAHPGAPRHARPCWNKDTLVASHAHPHPSSHRRAVVEVQREHQSCG